MSIEESPKKLSNNEAAIRAQLLWVQHEARPAYYAGHLESITVEWAVRILNESKNSDQPVSPFHSIIQLVGTVTNGHTWKMAWFVHINNRAQYEAMLAKLEEKYSHNLMGKMLGYLQPWGRIFRGQRSTARLDGLVNVKEPVFQKASLSWMVNGVITIVEEMAVWDELAIAAKYKRLQSCLLANDVSLNLSLSIAKTFASCFNGHVSAAVPA